MKKIFFLLAILLEANFLQAQWETDVRLTNTPDSSIAANNMSRSIAASGDTVHVVWCDKSDGNWEIYYKRSTDGGVTWEADARLTNDPSRSSSPGVAVSGMFVHVVWIDNRDGNNEIYYKRSTDGGTNWEGEVRLTNNLAYTYEPVIATSGQDVHVAWTDYDSGNGTYEVHYKRSVDGGVNWETDTWLSTGSLKSWNPSLAVTGSTVHLVRNDAKDGTDKIYYKHSMDSGVTWSLDTPLNNYKAYVPSVAVSGSNVYVVWRDDRYGLYVISFTSSTDNGMSWNADTRLTEDSYMSFSPNISANNSILHVVWCDDRDGNYGIYYKCSKDGGINWTTDKQLNDISFNSNRPSLTVSGQVVHAVWCDFRDLNYEIYYKRNPTWGNGPLLSIVPQNQIVPPLAGNTSFTVTSNSGWSAVSDASWCTVTGSTIGNGTIVANYLANTTHQTRKANIQVTVDGLPIQTVTVTQDRSTIGIEEDQGQAFRIYPNPSNGLFSIEYSGNDKVNWDVSVMDFSGRMVLEKHINQAKHCLIDISDQSSGCYFIKLKSDETIIERIVLIIK